MAAKPVAIIMGSQSDWATMKHAAETLDALKIGYDARIVSAHRTPETALRLRHSARENGFKVIIAGAGGAAHLPGMTASMTPLPVLGVPMNTHALEGKDSLLSIMQMPGGRSGRHAGDRQGRRDQCGAAGGRRCWRCRTAEAARPKRLDQPGAREADRSPSSRSGQNGLKGVDPSIAGAQC